VISKANVLTPVDCCSRREQKRSAQSRTEPKYRRWANAGPDGPTGKRPEIRQEQVDVLLAPAESLIGRQGVPPAGEPQYS
jgi:hypothetical protein